MPQQNYLEMEPEVLDAYRAIGKDVVAIKSFSALVPEVFYFGVAYQQQLQAFFSQLQTLALPLRSLEIQPEAWQQNAALSARLRDTAESQIRSRLALIERHLQQTEENFASFDKIF